MSCGSLSTHLDIEMLRKVGVNVSSSSVPDSGLPAKSGMEVERELSGRPLIRYLRKEDVKKFVFGDANRQCVTPTPYSVADLVSFLNLPDPTTKRTHYLLLEASKIQEVLGPRRIAWGGGIEYILPKGFPIEALLNRWAMEIR